MQYTSQDKSRRVEIPRDPNFQPESYRSPWRRDYGRLIHSPSFRRLEGKTQLFPGKEGDFFRNRLTHSQEVAQIAKSIAIKLNHDLKNAHEKYYIEPDVVEFAGLAHDLGHPPFGHFGEKALDGKMINYGGFESNAQALRIISKTEKRHLLSDTTLGIDSDGKDSRVGLNLTFRIMASILKYDNMIPLKKEKRVGEEGPVKGYYESEGDLIKEIKGAVCGKKKYVGPFKTIECQIMDIADDIAYSTYDLEDSFKAGFLKPIDLLCAPKELNEKVAKIVSKRTSQKISNDDVIQRIRSTFFGEFELPDHIEDFYENPKRKELEEFYFFSIEFAHRRSNSIAANAYDRINFTSKLVGSAVREVTIRKINRAIPALSKVELKKDKEIDVEILKNIVYESQILSPKIQIGAYRSKEIINTIFETLSEKGGHMLLPKDFRLLYESCKKPEDKKRVICDFIAGMTDRYALEFYGRLTSENPQTIFKPV